MLKQVVIFFCFIQTLLVLSFSEVSDNDDDGTVVKIESGFIRGRILKSENGSDFWAFQEVPYATPPLGENRFQLAKPPNAWNGILNTTKNTKICYQSSSMFANLIISEDCLYLNVYTPVKPGTSGSLPVLLWIHGGGWGSWSGAYEYYGPKYIMDYGVIVVTINYRLNAFGFLGTDDGIIPPHLGMKDQIFAMKWVHRNIHRFGGNKSHVTIAGESAGSITIGDHLRGPWEDGVELFQSAIMQSGSPISRIALNKTATDVAIELAKALDPNYSPKNTSDLLKFLQQADAKDILAAAITELPGPIGAFQSYLDKDFKKVPVLLGFNSEERVSNQGSINKKMLEEIDENPRVLVSDGVNMSTENRTVAGKLIKGLYTSNSSFVRYPGGYVRYSSDSGYTTAVCKLAELGSANLTYYLYQFAYKGELGGLMDIIPFEGAESVAHTEDLHYMWEQRDYNSDLSKFPEADQLTLHRYIRMWTNFIKYFNPTPEQDALLNNITWIKTEPTTLRYLNINTTLEMREYPRQYFLLKPIIENYMEPPFYTFS